MFIEIEKKNLVTLLARAQNIVEKRNTMPVLANVLLQVENKTLKIFAGNEIQKSGRSLRQRNFGDF